MLLVVTALSFMIWLIKLQVATPLPLTKPYRVVSGNLYFVDQKSDGTAHAAIQNGTWSYGFDAEGPDLIAQFVEFAGRDVTVTLSVSGRVFTPTSVRLNDQAYGNRR